MSHKNGVLCGSCEKKLESCHPDLAYWFRRIREEFPTAHISDGYRNKEQQNACCDANPPTSNLRFPKSKHNHCFEGKPMSLAMDIFSQDDEGKGSWRVGFFVQIANFLDDNQAPINWGGRFKSFQDTPHFELK